MPRKQNREIDGRYAYENNELLCQCGHTLGVHTAERAKVGGVLCQPCIVGDFTGRQCECECECFKKAKVQK
jgi:hypothetical protein